MRFEVAAIPWFFLTTLILILLIRFLGPLIKAPVRSPQVDSRSPRHQREKRFAEISALRSLRKRCESPLNMSKETRRDLVLTFITFLVSAAGVTSVFVGSRVLAWIAIVISDSYLAAVLLLAALRSDDANFLHKHSWIEGFFPRRTPGLFVAGFIFVAVISGFAGLYVGTETFSSSKSPLDALYISAFTLAFTDYSPKPGYGQVVVMGQFASGVLLLIALFPFLISRISTFKEL